MSRRPLIAGNWKMNKNLDEALELVLELKRLLASARHCDIAVIPPYVVLHPVAKKLEGANIALGAQELYPVDSGAYTGAVSAPMLAAVGCTYALVAHSERRQYFGENDASANERMKAALKAGLTPILCVGESLEQRRAGSTMEVVGGQVEAALADLDNAQLGATVIAYEPVWAIGTGEVAAPEQAQEVHCAIRERLRHRDAAVAENMRILYGGSMKAGNAEALLAQKDIDGGLIGGASLKADDFAAIVRAARS